MAGCSTEKQGESPETSLSPGASSPSHVGDAGRAPYLSSQSGHITWHPARNPTSPILRSETEVVSKNSSLLTLGCQVAISQGYSPRSIVPRSFPPVVPSSLLTSDYVLAVDCCITHAEAQWDWDWSHTARSIEVSGHDIVCTLLQIDIGEPLLNENVVPSIQPKQVHTRSGR